MLARAVNVPFEMELSSVQVPKKSAEFLEPLYKILEKLELSSVRVPKMDGSAGT